METILYNPQTIVRVTINTQMGVRDSFTYFPSRITRWRKKVIPEGIYTYCNTYSIENFLKEYNGAWFDYETKKVRRKRYIEVELVNKHSYTHWFDTQDELDKAVKILKAQTSIQFIEI